jgi:hypothetical protein
MTHVLLLLGCAISIYFACEMVRSRRRMARGSAEGRPPRRRNDSCRRRTALSESVVTLVAVLFGSPEHSDDISGAAMGGPLVVGTIAYGVTGAMLIWRKTHTRAAVMAVPLKHGWRLAALREAAGVGGPCTRPPRRRRRAAAVADRNTELPEILTSSRP